MNWMNFTIILVLLVLLLVSFTCSPMLYEQIKLLWQMLDQTTDVLNVLNPKG